MPEASPAHQRRAPFSPAAVLLLERGHSAASVAREKNVTRQLISLQLTGERPLQRSTFNAIAKLTNRSVATAIRARTTTAYLQRHPDSSDADAFVDDTKKKVGASS